MEKKQIISTQVSTGPFRAFVEEIFSLAQRKPSSYVCFANVHMVTEAYKDREFNKLLNEADIVTPDGGPLPVFLKMFYGLRQDRVPGMDLLPVLLREAEARGKSVYFYGTTDEVLGTIVRKAGQEFPGLRIAGTFSPPFRTLSGEEDADICRMINGTEPDLVFVALGCPKQEKWMASHQGKVNGCMLGVGQAFLTYAGLEKRLPKWARNLSLEWVYRLYLEPRRLWKRYLVNNSLFVLLVLKEGVSQLFRSNSGRGKLNHKPL